jgi:arylsulfatase A-like enzyme/NAD-dependent dihydropyrimidine dehydrogenase PreA subunit
MGMPAKKAKTVRKKTTRKKSAPAKTTRKKVTRKKTARTKTARKSSPKRKRASRKDAPELARAKAAGAGRTNVVFILTDDQGPWALGCAGNSEIRTPNLDALAARGMRFENFFCASPVCSPSRASFMTGRIPSQHGVHDWLSGGNVSPDAIEYLEGLTTYTEVLARHGYACGISGKWHLGASERPQAGFDHWFVHQKGGGPYNDAPMVRDGALVNEPGYVTTVITDDALEYIDAHAAEPFYLSVHYTAPHAPWTGHPEDIVASYDDCPFDSCPQEEQHPWAWLMRDCFGNREMLKGYFAAVTAMDIEVGRIVAKLDELGLRERTLVVFVSDNGFSCGHHGIWGKGNGTSPLNMFENSVKVPAIMSHPGRIPEGAVSGELVSAYDFMPTLLEYLGLPALDDATLPGASFVPVLEGGPSGREDVVVYDEYGPVRMIRTREWKYVGRYPDGPDELYDLANDPGERTNLVDEAAQSKRVGDMRGRLDEWFARYVDPARDGLRQPVTGRGQEKKQSGAEPDPTAFKPLPRPASPAAAPVAGKGDPRKKPSRKAPSAAARRTVLEVGPDCHGCGVCVDVCPREAITMVEAEGRVRARIDTAKCDLCRKCLDACPVEAIGEPYPPAWREE